MGLGATMRVRRSRANFWDLGMSDTLLIDGADAGQIWSRQTRTFEVSPGMHELEVRFLWIRRSRLEVLLTEGEERSFECKTFVGMPILRGATEKEIVEMQRNSGVRHKPRNLGESKPR
jgi:hypothetical protein